MIANSVKSRSPQGLRNTLRPFIYFAQRELLNLKAAQGDGIKKPDFLILGAQKAGTTTLYDVLCQHPFISAARTKEIAFFDRYYGRGVSWYSANFSARHGLTGEATPDYIFDPVAQERILELLPDAKFIVLLRNPIDRAISQYFHARRLGYEHLSFEEALEQEAERIGSQGHRFAGNPIEGRRYYHAYSYLARGDYASQLERWFDAAGRDRFYIEFSDRFFQEPAEVSQEIFEFLGLESGVELVVRPKNVGRYTTKVSQESYNFLEEHFRPHNERLAALLGSQIPW